MAAYDNYFAGKLVDVALDEERDRDARSARSRAYPLLRRYPRSAAASGPGNEISGRAPGGTPTSSLPSRHR